MRSLTGVKSYIAGLVISIILTLLAYGLVSIFGNQQQMSISFFVLLPILLVLALFQLIAQLVFFLHLGRESSQKFRVIFFVSTFAAILVVVVSSIWIMTSLNYRM
ncbi:MAG TPA: cytochrome C oxidase subunit IV family protein, partial [Ktedonobacterales bacterium]